MFSNFADVLFDGINFRDVTNIHFWDIQSMEILDEWTNPI